MKGLILMAITLSSAAASGATSLNLEIILKKPLITGASVSAGWLAPSPGKVLALRYTSDSHIRTVAQGGRSSLETVARLTDKDLADRTSVIAVDAFFWDGLRRSPEESIKTLNNLIERTEKLKIPLVIGDIPALLPSRQPSALAINKEIHRLCQVKNHCYVLRLDALVRQVLTEGSIEIQGKRYGLLELLPDGLHINKIASEGLADRIRDLF